MKIVKVTYTTRAEFAAQNAENIRVVMNALQQLGRNDLLYHVCLSPDGQTFTHTAFFHSEEGEKTLLSLDAFVRFQTQLKESRPEAPPRQELLTFVGSSRDLFNA